MTPEDNAQLVSIIVTVGALLPLLTSVIQQRTWSTKTRTVVAVGVSALAGIVTYVTQFGLNLNSPSALAATVVGMVLAAGTAYKSVWKPIGVAPTLEGATSPKPKPEPVPAEAEPIDETDPEVDAVDDTIPTEHIPPTGLAAPDGFDDGSGQPGR